MLRSSSTAFLGILTMKWVRSGTTRTWTSAHWDAGVTGQCLTSHYQPSQPSAISCCLHTVHMSGCQSGAGTATPAPCRGMEAFQAVSLQPSHIKHLPQTKYICNVCLFLGLTDWHSRIGRDGSKILYWSVAFEKIDIPFGIQSAFQPARLWKWLNWVK